jgi:hypothetical protein
MSKLLSDFGYLKPGDKGYDEAIREDNAKTYKAIQEVSINPYDPDAATSGITVYGAHKITGTGWEASIDHLRGVKIKGSADYEDLILLGNFARDVGSKFVNPHWEPGYDWGIDAAMMEVWDNLKHVTTPDSANDPK